MSILDSPGRFGTIQLLRQRSATSSSVTDIEHVITSFGVDSQTVSFGRDTSCSVRLYYPDVDAVHARIVFNQDLGGKAFLEVLGESGVRVDGCVVYPSGEGGNTSGSGGNGSRGGSPRTIALGDKSELEIHGKRFRFVYPPKEIRKQLAATPPRPGNRALRLSMIASAQVFSPRPSADPVQNLRILQSPLRAPFGSPSSRNSGSRGSSRSGSNKSTPSPSPARGRSVSPVKYPTPAEGDDNEEEEESITLVQGSQPRVVEEAADLVILEDVVLEAPLPALNVKNALVRTGSSADLNGQQERGRSGPTPPAAPAPPRTPRRQSLHRAVLIRSAQRAVWAANSPASASSNSNSGSSANSAANSPNTSANTSANSRSSSSSAGGPVVRGWVAPAASSTSPRRALGAQQPPDDEGEKTDTDSEGEGEESDTEAEEAEVRELRLEVVSVSSGSDVSDDEEGAFRYPGAGEDDGEEPLHDHGAAGENGEKKKTLGWRKSLEKLAIWPFGRVKKEEEDVQLPDAPPGSSSPTSDDEAAGDAEEGGAETEDVEVELVGMSTPTQQTTPTQTPRRKTVQPITPRERSPFKITTPIAPRSPSPSKSTTPFSRAPGGPATPAQVGSKTPARAQGNTPFGAPHPAARTPAGFGRKSIGTTELDTGHHTDDLHAASDEDNDGAVREGMGEEGVVPMNIDGPSFTAEEDEHVDTERAEQDAYTPLYEDLSGYQAKIGASRKIDLSAPQFARPKTPPTRARALNTTFMTPQAPRPTAAFPSNTNAGAAPGGGAPRYSLGGAARRVPVEDSPWKVRDILVGQAPGTPAHQRHSGRAAATIPGTPLLNGTPARARMPVSEEERRAISERRRSALKAPDAFFAGGVPGMSPVKRGGGLGRVRESIGTAFTPGGEGAAEQNTFGEKKNVEEGKEEDTRSMLANLRETVEGLKRRRESVLGVAGRRASDESVHRDVDLQVPDPQQHEENAQMEMEVAEEQVMETKDNEKPRAKMLRGRVREETPSQLDDENQAEAEAEPVITTTTKGRRARKPTTEPEEMDVDVAPAPAPVKATRRTRKATTPTPVPAAEAEAEMALDPTPAPVPTKSTRRTRKPVIDDAMPTNDEADEMAVDPVPLPASIKPTRRSRKPTAEPESHESNDEPAAGTLAVPAAPMKTRRGRAATAEPESEKDKDVESAPTPDAPARRARKPPSTSTDVPALPAAPATEPVAAPKRRGRAPKATTPASVPAPSARARSRAPADTAEADPLDTIDVDADDEVQVVAVVPPKRRARSRSVKAVKEEDAEPVLEGEGESVAVPPARGRGKKAIVPPVPAIPNSAAAPAVPKSRARKAAVPASAPAAVEGEKENKGAAGEDEEEGEPVKVRVSRSRKVKEEAVEVDTAATVPRRATRTRTRT